MTCSRQQFGVPETLASTNNQAPRHRAEPTSTEAVGEIAALVNDRRERRTNIFIRSGYAPPGSHESLIGACLSRRHHLGCVKHFGIA